MHRPPVIARWILSVTNRKSNREIVLGDFDEFYDDICSERGALYANAWFCLHALKSIPAFLKTNFYWGVVMFRNYLKMAIRSFVRHKAVTTINILGLSVALACATLFYLFVLDELSYDRFHKNVNNIYSVINTDNYYNYNYRPIPNATGPALKEFFPEIKQQVRISRDHVTVKYQDKIFNEDLYFADANFFDMFSFNTITGNPHTMLVNENSIVLTESSAEKYFNGIDAVGKQLTVMFGSQPKEFMVSGIIENLPRNSTIQFNMLTNIKNIAAGQEGLTSWTWPRNNTYVELNDNIDPKYIDEQMPNFVKQYMTSVIAERKSRGTWLQEGETIEFWLQNMKDIYLKSDFATGNEFSNINNSIILAAIGFLVLFIAGINFVNISIGRASTRALEVGVRKVLGAERKNLIIQHWVESIATVAISMIAGLFLTLLLMPLFNEIANKQFLPEDIFTLQNISVMLIAIIVIGIAAGSFPGIFISRFQPVEIMKGKLKVGGNNFLTKSMIVIQFSVSVFLIISTLTMNKQLDFINSTDLGFDKEGIVTLSANERDFNTNDKIFNLVKTKAENCSNILSVSGCIFPFSEAEGEGMLQMNGKRIHYNFTGVYYNYIKTMGMTLVEGRDFSPDIAADMDAIVVNEEFVKQFELDNPIGMRTPSGSTIIGVVKNYNYRSLQNKIEPVIHWIDERWGPYTLLFRISTKNISGALAEIENIWKDIQPDKPFNYNFFDQELATRYAKEQRWSAITFYSSLFAIFITCIGLIGMTSIITERRIKEIGIRKVLGASVKQISQNLFGNFIILMGISFAITFPLGYYLMNNWLENFAYRTNLGVDTFLISGILSLTITIATISYQVIKAAMMNPVDILKYE